MSNVAESDRRELDGKRVVITGAGSGVGRAMANLFAQNGASVVIVDVVPARVEQVVKEVKALPADATGLVVDLSKAQEVDRMVDQVLAGGRIDVLCNNAGIMDGANPVADTTDELWDTVMNIDLNAPFRASRKVIPSMLTQGGGNIINTASAASFYGGVAGAAYTVAKHGLVGLTRSIAAHYGTKGIRCNAMVLGGVNTAIGLGSGMPNQAGLEHVMKASSLIPRMAEPKEIAELALFLASSRSSYMNGSCVVIDAGWTVL